MAKPILVIRGLINAEHADRIKAGIDDYHVLIIYENAERIELEVISEHTQAAKNSMGGDTEYFFEDGTEINHEQN